MAARRTFCAAVLGTAVAVAVLTGCGGDTDAGGAPIVVPAATTAETGAFAGESADQIFSKAEEAMDSVTAVTVDVVLSDDEGDAHITAALTASGKCAASLENDGEDPVQVIGIHDAYYLKADASYWEDQDDSHGDVLARAFAGKWVRLPAQEQEADDLDQFCKLDSLLASVEEGDEVTGKDAPASRYGRAVVPLHERDDDGTTNTVYVAADGTPYILGLVSTDGGGGLRFSDFGKAPRISAPPAKDTVDLSSVGSDAPHLSV
ncbi:hypothetical protein [Streptomyces sp. NBC_00448]|uniref:hypothetical protein n=1 Tax=Streptomyces sp. NBC_00448 TaxID=2903652 RepID=UPI002E1A15F3